MEDKAFLCSQLGRPVLTACSRSQSLGGCASGWGAERPGEPVAEFPPRHLWVTSTVLQEACLQHSIFCCHDSWDLGAPWACFVHSGPVLQLYQPHPQSDR